MRCFLQIFCVRNTQISQKYCVEVRNLETSIIYLNIENKKASGLLVRLFYLQRHFFFKFLGDIIPFYGSPISLFWTSTFLPMCNGFLRFACVVTPAGLLVASKAAEPFSIHALAHVYMYTVGPQSRIERATAS